MHTWELSQKNCIPIIAFETRSGARTIAYWAEDAVTRSELFYPKLMEAKCIIYKKNHIFIFLFYTPK